jgi:hypothetical protein
VAPDCQDQGDEYPNHFECSDHPPNWTQQQEGSPNNGEHSEADRQSERERKSPLSGIFLTHMVNLKLHEWRCPFRFRRKELLRRLERLRIESNATDGAQVRKRIQVELPRSTAVVSVFHRAVEVRDHLVPVSEEQDQVGAQTFPADCFPSDVRCDDLDNDGRLVAFDVCERELKVLRVMAMHMILDHDFPLADEDCLSMGLVEVQSGCQFEILSGGKGYVVPSWNTRFQQFLRCDVNIDIV